jgi:hypothetical protein
VDQELLAYLDRRDQEFIAYLDRRLSDLETRLKSEITTELRAEIAASAAETRHHFDVVVDRLMDKIQLVGEGVIGVDQKLDRFRGEGGEHFRRVDHRLLRLEAKLYS